MVINSEIDKNFISCPECGGNIISITNSAEDVCSQCGLIVSERKIDFARDGKRAYTQKEKQQRNRTGAPISDLLPDIGLSTVIDKHAIENPELKRAAKWNTRITWDKRNLLIATTELKRIASNLNLPDYVKSEAMRLYREAFKKKLLRGRSINGMVAACLYYACRTAKIPRTFQELLDETSEDAKNVRRCYRTLIREFNLKVPNRDARSLIPKYIIDLNLDNDVRNLCIKILETYFDRFSSSGKDPKGFCAGAIYLACKLKNREVTQKFIADTIGVTEVTLRSRFKELVAKLNIKV